MWESSIVYTRVKLCEFESLDTAYEASQMGADALGFHLFRYHNCLERVQQFREIFSYLPATVNKVLLTDVDYRTLVGVCSLLEVDTIQLYPDWEPDKILQLRQAIGEQVRILKVMSALPEENSPKEPELFLRHFSDVADGFLLDSQRVGGTGRTADWEYCAGVVATSRRPVFLAGGLTAENVGRAIEKVKPFGVDVENGVSIRLPDGSLVKNMRKCLEFLTAVKETDRRLGQ